MANATSAGDGSMGKEDRADYTDKSEPIRVDDCIWCMACVEQSDIEFHQKASESFLKVAV
jgi:hypothetical protein